MIKSTLKPRAHFYVYLDCSMTNNNGKKEINLLTGNVIFFNLFLKHNVVSYMSESITNCLQLVLQFFDGRTTCLVFQMVLTLRYEKLDLFCFAICLLPTYLYWLYSSVRYCNFLVSLANAFEDFFPVLIGLK